MSLEDDDLVGTVVGTVVLVADFLCSFLKVPPCAESSSEEESSNDDGCATSAWDNSSESL